MLRAPVMPDMTADRGIHRFTYSVMPFSGPFVHSRVTEEAYECNVKVTAAGFGGAIPAGERGTIFERASTRLLGLTSVKDVPDRVKRAFDCNMME